MFYLYFDVQIARHELGHSLGMGHTYTHAYPPGWDCGPSGAIMSGNDRTEWNPCGKMDFKRMYTQYSANWCLPSKQIVQNVVKRQERESRKGKCSNLSTPVKCQLKFMFSKKATKIDEIFIVDLTLCSKCQIDGEDFVNFYGLLRKHEL